MRSLIAMETLEENLEEQKKISPYRIGKLKRKEVKMLAEELRAISSGLEGRVYEPSKREKLVNISKYINDTTKFLTEKISEYVIDNLKNFCPTSQKILSSIILGPTISLFMNEFLKQYKINSSTEHLIYIGTITSVLSYCLQSLYQKQDNF